MRTLLASSVLLVALGGCHGSPTDAGPPPPARLTFDFPSSISASRDRVVSFGASVVGGPDVGSWERVGITFDPPAILDWQTVQFTAVEGDSTQVTRPLPDGGGGFDIIVDGPDFGPGRRVSFRATANVLSGVRVGKKYPGQLDAVAFNKKKNNDFLELDLQKFTTTVTE